MTTREGGAAGSRRRGLRRPGVLAWLHLMRLANRTERGGAERLRQWSLSMAQFDVLAHVGAREGITQSALADRLVVTQGNITQLLDKLERRGLLVRRPEGRTNYLYLTEEGRRLFEEVTPGQEDLHAAQMAAGLEAEEQRELLRLLSKLDSAQRGNMACTGHEPPTGADHAEGAVERE